MDRTIKPSDQTPGNVHCHDHGCRWVFVVDGRWQLFEFALVDEAVTCGVEFYRVIAEAWVLGVVGRAASGQGNLVYPITELASLCDKWHKPIGGIGIQS
ncbi:hypothetical protein [Ruegeria sp. Alg231-54]|uniref:hypothetical protein n=1 Tax=Ruegeria sp. Alg231-54 TaxID=1922221 RepID=UPI000D560AE9|nr:hypothetical protein [Ruegeria sp. Alg231-54]